MNVVWLVVAGVALSLGLFLMPVSADDKVSYTGDCEGQAAEQWLAGVWHSAFAGDDKVTVEIRRAGSEFVWKYDRGAGVVTQRWGQKATAQATGKVTLVDGCTVELRGRYSAYGGTQMAVGTPMEYSMVFDGRLTMSGSGLGFGRERFRDRWVKAQ